MKRCLLGLPNGNRSNGNTLAFGLFHHAHRRTHKRRSKYAHLQHCWIYGRMMSFKSSRLCPNSGSLCVLSANRQESFLHTANTRLYCLSVHWSRNGRNQRIYIWLDRLFSFDSLSAMLAAVKDCLIVLHTNRHICICKSKINRGYSNWIPKVWWHGIGWFLIKSSHGNLVDLASVWTELGVSVKNQGSSKRVNKLSENLHG